MEEGMRKTEKMLLSWLQFQQRYHRQCHHYRSQTSFNMTGFVQWRLLLSQVLGAESHEQLCAVVALYVTVSISIVKRRHDCSEEVVSALVHSLKVGLASSCVDLKAASYMILSQLCVSAMLSTSVVNRLVSRLVKVRHCVHMITHLKKNSS